MALLPHRDYLVENFLIYLIILLNISVSYLNRGSRENHPSLKFLPCLLSRLKLVAVLLINSRENWGEYRRVTHRLEAIYGSDFSHRLHRVTRTFYFRPHPEIALVPSPKSNVPHHQLQIIGGQIPQTPLRELC